MRHRRHLFIPAAIFFCTEAFAGTMGSVAPPQDWRWVGSMNIGPVWESAGKTQTFYLASDIIKTYATSNATHALVDGEVFVGVKKRFTQSVARTIRVGSGGDQ